MDTASANEHLFQGYAERQHAALGNWTRERGKRVGLLIAGLHTKGHRVPSARLFCLELGQ